MHLAKLVNTLQRFDTTGLLRLKEYVNSPYFKVPKASVNLFNYFYELHPVFPQRKTTPEVIGEKFDNLSTPSKQNAAGSRLLDSIDSFVALEAWQRNPYEVKRQALSGLKEMHRFDEFDKEYSKTYQELTESPEQDIDTFFQKHLLAELSLNGFDTKLKRTNKNDLGPVLKTLDEFYALKKLRYLCDILERQRIFGTQYQKQDVFPLLDILKPYTNEQNSYVFLFVHVYLMLSADTYEESTGPYNIIKEFTATKSEGVLPQSLIECITFCMNYALRWYNKGLETAGDEYLWWIDLKMKKNLLLENGKMTPISFRNICSIATISKNNADWLNLFISRYATMLPDSHREANEAFAKGLHQYKLGRYKEATRCFMLAQAGDEITFNCIIRRWQFMSMYNFEAGDIDTLTNHLSSFDKYLQRHAKHVASIRTAFDTFIHYSNQLMQASPYDIGETFFIALENENHFPGKTWLLQQFEAKAQKSRVKVVRSKNS
jgi:hypothetical protein